MGAGSVGCWVGGRLAAAGARVHFIGRPRVVNVLRTQGLTLSDVDGPTLHVAPDALDALDALHASELPPDGAAPGLVLLAVKSAGTEAATATGARAARGHAAAVVAKRCRQRGTRASRCAAVARRAGHGVLQCGRAGARPSAPRHARGAGRAARCGVDSVAAAVRARGPAAGAARRSGARAVGQAAAQPEQPGECAVAPAAARRADAARLAALLCGVDG